MTGALLASVPTPSGMTSREIVRRAIEFPLADLSKLDAFEFPDVADVARYDWM